jgi:hypothetical protein
VGGDVVDLGKAGTYTIKYWCKNDAGTVAATRKVVVGTKYNPKCTEVSVIQRHSILFESSPAAKAVLGNYILETEKHDGRPIYKQVNGTGHNHIWYFGDTRAGVSRWAISPFSLKQVRNAHWGGDKDTLTQGYRSEGTADRPEEELASWQFHNKNGYWENDFTVSVVCSSTKNKTDFWSVSASVEITGYDTEDFGENEKFEFSEAVANKLDLSQSAVRIIRTMNVNPPHPKKRRLGEMDRLLAAKDPLRKGLGIDFSVRTTEENIEILLASEMRTPDFQDGLYDEMKQSDLQVRAILVKSSSVTEHAPGEGGPHRKIMVIIGAAVLGLGALMVGGESLTKLRGARAGIPVQPASSMEEATPLTSTGDGAEGGGTDLEAEV